MKAHATTAEIAELVGRNPEAIRRVIAQHGVKKTAQGYVVRDVMAALKKSSEALTRAPLADGDPRKVKVMLENRLLEIKIGEADGRLVDAEKVEQDAQRIGTAIRNDLLAMPAALAPRVAGKTDLAEIAAIVDAMVRDALRHLSDEVTK